MMKFKWLILFSFFISQIFAATKPNQPVYQVQQQVGAVSIQFEMKRVNLPTVLQYAKSPLTWRAYLPVCPPGSKYVGGVNPNMVQLDYPPNYPYCNCICKGNCGALAGITAPAGQQNQPMYTAKVTCETTVHGWFDPATMTEMQTPHRYTYCQSGACTNNPLPANLGYSVPVGGTANTIKIDFVACPLAVAAGCGTPDPISLSRQ